MDEFEFRHLLQMFPVVRSRDYHADLDSSRQPTRASQSDEVKEVQNVAESSKSKNLIGSSENDHHEMFWRKLKMTAEQKMSPVEAEKFCKAFQQVYKKLVYEELTLDDARRFMSS